MTATAAVTVLSGSCSSVADSPRVVGTLPTSGVVTLQRRGTPLAPIPLGGGLLSHLPPPRREALSGLHSSELCEEFTPHHRRSRSRELRASSTELRDAQMLRALPEYVAE